MKSTVLVLGALALVGCASGSEAGHGSGEHTTHGHEVPTHKSDGDEQRGHEKHGHAKHGHGSKEGFKHDFSDAERWSQVFDDPDRNAWQKPEKVVELMDVPEGGTVADVGAGTGYFLPHLHNAVGAEGRVIALDVEESLVQHMTRRAAEAGLSTVQAKKVPYDDPTLEAASTDRILIVNTWHHIGDRIEYGKKLRAALKEGGALYIVDYTMDAERGPPPDHRLSADAVKKELEAAGFTAEIVEEPLPLQYIVVGR